MAYLTTYWMMIVPAAVATSAVGMFMLGILKRVRDERNERESLTLVPIRRTYTKDR